MKKYIIICALVWFYANLLTSQVKPNFYRQYLPINSHAQLSYLSSGSELESILFDAKPIARYHIYNDMLKRNIRVDQLGKAFFISFRPQIRMYNSQSKPVRTPSYKIGLGSQWSRLYNKGKNRAVQLAISLESGHYSNGQPNCFLSDQLLDGTIECDNLYDLIGTEENISSRINRSSGNFSTNWTELIFQYKWVNGTDENKFESISHSLRFGYTHYHNRFLMLGKFGGYSDNDIKLYGNHFFQGLYEYNSYFKFANKTIDFLLIQRLDLVLNADPRIPKIRTETKLVLFPFGSDLGVFSALIIGKDDYNIRFVDKVTQFQIGLTWTGRMKLNLDFDDEG